ncbi:MAG: AAA family ATPase [Clostridia bacterium]|nr:AAA family ATPase [Clostridia bacterium]
MEVWDKRKNNLLHIVIQNSLLDELDREYANPNAKTANKYRNTLFYPYSSEEDLKDYVIKKLKVYGLNNDWYPSLSEYDPKISKEQWLDFFNNSGMFNDKYKYVMAAAYSISENITCDILAEKFEGTAAQYAMSFNHIAEKVQSYTNCEKFNDDEHRWHRFIMFFCRPTEIDNRRSYVWKMRKPLKEALREYGIEKYIKKSGGESTMKNIILYGPPGTGKTYNTVCYAVAICEGKRIDDVIAEAKSDYSSVKERYDELKNNGRIEFTTFHQSYGYEEFIEGIRPVMNDSEEAKTVEYEIADGIFKAFCEKASEPISSEEKLDIGLNNSPTVWKVSLEGTGNNPTRSECMENGHIRIGYDSYGENITDETDFSVDGGERVIKAFINKMRIGDIVLSCFSSTTIDAIGVITGDYEWHDEYDNYKRLRNVNWIIKGIREDISTANGSNMTLASAYKLNISVSDVLGIIKKYSHNDSISAKNEDNYVFIIDEINRGNISKIFGELITLIEPSKRLGQPEELRSILPYSKKPFGVPDNVYIIGTMNTADRSIATIDTALRRRFSFKEMLPDSKILGGIEVDKINIENMLESMNNKISILFDREHTIGHAYFMSLKDNPTIETLANIFKNNIIPLLQEYFYEDYEKIRLVLGDNKKQDETQQFIKAISNDYSTLFGGDIDFDVSYRYEINEAAFILPEAYKYI